MTSSQPVLSGTTMSSIGPVLLQAMAHSRSGRPDRALDALATIARTARKSEAASHACGLILFQAEQMTEAVRWFTRALRLKPDFAEALVCKGLALQALGRPDEALACFDRALKLRPRDAETWYNRGVALQALGQLDPALQSYEAALAERPDYVKALASCGVVLDKLDRLEEALACLEAALALAPRDAEMWCNRGNVLQKLDRWRDVVGCYTTALDIKPGFAAALNNRGAAFHALGHPEAALADVSEALRLEPEFPDALVNRAVILEALDRRDEARDDYRQARRLRPLLTLPATKAPADFSVLFIFAPGAGNTPPDCLIGAAAHESHTLIFLDDDAADLPVPGDPDLVVNLVSDVDQSRAILPRVGDLIDRFGKPVVNHPRGILRTDRDSVCALLAGAPHCLVPATRRYAGAALRELAADREEALAFPVLVRLAGSHGGVDFELMHDRPELDRFVARSPGSDYYLTQYVDYRSADGLFRKYRFIFVEDEILPYHLAIDDKWKVHHATTDMADHPWMQREEAFFLDNPWSVFGPPAQAALAAIRARVGLEYFGIDCALDRNGDVVVFEVNASMLVHQRNDKFPYKREPVRRIKAAFDAMLARKAVRRKPS